MTGAEPAGLDAIEASAGYFTEHGPAWRDLLEYRRVTILAEAGSGKTDEMRNQAKRLTAESGCAFFLSLESMVAGPLASLLEVHEKERFASWFDGQGSPAWFFLDSVDELKLGDHKLDQALLTLANAIPGRLRDARIIISCRPSDWRPSVDLVAFRRRLPIPPSPPKCAPVMDPEEYFLTTLEPPDSKPGFLAGEDETSKEHGDTFRTVVLLPLSDRQIKSFVTQLDIPDREGFLAEIDGRDAWDFARRPLDLLELAGVWSRERKLGERQGQHETDVATKLRDDPDRRDGDLIGDLAAREGVERLALALTLTRRQLIRAGDATLDPLWAEGTLDPADILPEWSPKQRQALLRRALFDPATLGRVRFHHRSVQEYLSACRLRSLRERGMPIREVLRLFFATSYGEDVVIPSRAPIAAWLALWDAPVRQGLIRLEPDILLSMGDPASLDHSVRAELMASFAAAYGHGSWRGVRVPASELKRLAVPELAPTIVRLWGAGPANIDVRLLLLTAIWQGKLGECIGITSSVAADSRAADHERVIAIRALLACGAAELASSIAANMVAEPSAWSDRVVESVACDMFPGYLTVEDLIGLMERTPEHGDTAGGFGWNAEQMIAALDDPRSLLAVSLREGMAKLIMRGRAAGPGFHDLKSRSDHFTSALTALCIRQLPGSGPDADEGLVRACVVAGRFDAKIHRSRGDPDPLREAFRDSPSWRAEAFRQEVTAMDELASGKDAWHRYYYAEHGSVLVRLKQADRPWLETMLADDRHPGMKEVALQGLLALWTERGRRPEDIARMRATCGTNTALLSMLDKRTLPVEPDPEVIRAEQEAARSVAARAAAQAAGRLSWVRWRQELLADPEKRFRAADVQLTMWNLYKWAARRQGTADEPDGLDSEAVARAFSPEVATLARDAFRNQWRSTPPRLWSQRPATERNSRLYSWLEGYMGITMEAQEPGWEVRLSVDEARTAAAYATVKLNGLAEFLVPLAAARPEQVDEVIGSEMTAQLAVGSENPHLSMMQDIAGAHADIRRLLAPRLLEALKVVDPGMEADAAANWCHHLDHAWRILEDILSSDVTVAATALIAEKVRLSKQGTLRLAWLKGLFLFDPEVATRLLEEMLDPTGPSEAAEAFTQLFDDRSWLSAEISTPDRARVLTRLVRSAYRVIRHEDDEVRGGIRSVGFRERAEMVRNRLFNLLVDTAGPEARDGLIELAADEGFSAFPDRLRLLARRRAAFDAEPVQLSPADVQGLEARFCIPPQDRDGLMATMIHRLDDLAEIVAHHDFTDRATLRSIAREEEMQRTLALRLEAISRGAYLVTREDEVADRKRTDIRLSASTNVRAAIEIKMVESWTVPQLEQALRDQLVGQYLRYPTCRAGCLLLTYSGRQLGWEVPGERRSLDFGALLLRLAELAACLEAESSGGIRLQVFGLDLTDPHLAPAHGGTSGKSRPAKRAVKRRTPRE